MGNKLVIVESPAKARTIGKILGSDYNLMASMSPVSATTVVTLRNSSNLFFIVYPVFVFCCFFK